MEKLVEDGYLTTNNATRGRHWNSTPKLRAMAFKYVGSSPDVILAILKSTLKLYPNLSDYKKPLIEKMIATIQPMFVSDRMRMGNPTSPSPLQPTH